MILARRRAQDSGTVPIETDATYSGYAGLASALTWPGLMRWLAVMWLMLAAAAACGDSPPVVVEPPPPSPTPRPRDVQVIARASVLITPEQARAAPRIRSIKVSPIRVVVDPGESVKLTAEALTSDRRGLSDVEFVWTAFDPRVGTISKEGEFQAGNRPGKFENVLSVTGIHNTIDGIKYAKSSVSVTIVGDPTIPTLSSVEIIPKAPTILSRQIYRLRAVGFDQDGLVIPGAALVWRVNDPRLGRVNNIGYLTIQAKAGAYPEAITVTAIWEDIKVSATTDVAIVDAPKADDFLSVQALPQRFFLQAGDRLQLKAVALNGLGEMVAGTQLRWSVEDAAVGTIDGKGNFIAGAVPGVYTEAVRVEAIIPGERGFVRAEDFASVVIKQKPKSSRLEAVTTQPTQVTLAPGGRLNLLARAIDESGKPAKNVTISWTMRKDEAGEVTDLGAFKAGRARGTHSNAIHLEVTQHLAGQEITKTRTIDVVITGRLATAEVHPAIATIASGRTVHFSVTGWDENKTDLTGLVVVWGLIDDAVGTIDAFGNFTAGQTPGLYENVIRAKVIQKPADPG